MSTQINRASVMLETVGTVEISHIFMPIDSFGHSATGRPLGGYYEVAVLWDDKEDIERGIYGGNHCYIVDSNVTDRTVTNALFERLCDERELADLMLDLYRNPRGWDC